MLPWKNEKSGSATAKPIKPMQNLSWGLMSPLKAKRWKQVDLYAGKRRESTHIHRDDWLRDRQDSLGGGWLASK